MKKVIIALLIMYANTAQALRPQIFNFESAAVKISGTWYNTYVFTPSSQKLGATSLPVNLGTFLRNSGGLELQSGGIMVYVTPTGGPCSANFYYRIYPEGSTAPDFLQINTTGFQSLSDDNHSAEMPVPAIDLTNNPAGNYKLELYYDATATVFAPCDITLTENNNDAYYAATFTIDGPMPITFGAVTAKLNENNLMVNWTSLTETNNHHFEIEASTDGVHFQKIGQDVLSKAKDGKSDAIIQYDFSYPIGNGLLSSIGLAALLLVGKRRKWFFIILAILCTGYFSCKKSQGDVINSSGQQKLFVRIAQVDKDGTKTYSKIVQVVQK